MMRQIRCVATILALSLSPSVGFAGSSSVQSSTPTSHAPIGCLPYVEVAIGRDSPIRFDRSIVHKAAITGRLTETRKIGPCIDSLLRLSHEQSISSFDPIAETITRGVDVPAAIAFQGKPAHLTDETDDFDPSLVVSSGSNGSVDTSGFEIVSGSPAIALLALAVIGMAAVSRRAPGAWSANTKS